MPKHDRLLRLDGHTLSRIGALAGAQLVCITLDRVQEADDKELDFSRPFRAGELEFLVGSSDPGLIELAEKLFRDLPMPTAPRDEMSCLLFVPSGAPHSKLYDVTAPVLGALRGVTSAAALTAMVTALSRMTLDAETHRLHLHAAAAVRDGRAAVLAGRRGSGKTTTLARLVLSGWSYISDEAVSIGSGDDQIRGYPKPLSIKPGSRTLLPEIRPHCLPTGQVSDDAILHASLGSIGASACESATPHLLALLRRPKDAAAASDPVTKRIHPVDAVVGAMAETLDAGRFGRDAVGELARLATRSLCYEILLGDPTSTVAEIERLFLLPAESPMPIEELPGRGRIPSKVLSILIGDRVVIHEQPEGHVLALDPTATQVWLNLGGWAVSETIDLNGPVVAPFVQQLVDLGLVTS